MRRMVQAEIALAVCALGLLVPRSALSQDTRSPEAIAVQIGLERACLPELQARRGGAALGPEVDRGENGPAHRSIVRNG